MTAKYFDDLRELIAAAEAYGMPEEARLILLGKIAYAVERGDITLNQGDELDALLGGVRKRHARAFEIATFGDADEG